MGKPVGLPDHNTPGFEDEATQNAVLSFLERLEGLHEVGRTEEERRVAANRIVSLGHGYWWNTEGPGAPADPDEEDTWRSRKQTRQAFEAFQRILEELSPSARANTAEALFLNLPRSLVYALQKSGIPGQGSFLDLLQTMVDAAIHGLGRGNRPRAYKSETVFLLVDLLHDYLGPEQYPTAPEVETLWTILFGKEAKVSAGGIITALRRE